MTSASGSFQGLTIGAAENADFLVGAGSLRARHAEEAGDFENLTAVISAIAVRGYGLPKGAPAPRFFANSNFSAPAFGSVAIVNIDYPSGDGPFGIFAADGQPAGKIKSFKVTDTEGKDRSGRWTPADGPFEPEGNFVICLLP